MTHRGFFIYFKNKQTNQPTKKRHKKKKKTKKHLNKKTTQTLFVFLREQTLYSFTIRCILQLVFLPQAKQLPMLDERVASQGVQSHRLQKFRLAALSRGIKPPILC